jgi:hypothetical protein
MDNEVYSFALKNTLGEIQNICPDIKNSFMFKEDGEIIAGDENTPERTIVKVIDSFDGILEKADTVGGVDGITIESSEGRVNVSCMNDLYLVTVTSKNADENYVKTVTHVLIPTVLKLLERIASAPLKNIVPEPKMKPYTPTITENERPTQEPEEELTAEELGPQSQPEIQSERVLPEPPVNQFIVENIGGLLVPTDTVRIDNDTLSQWQELYEDRKIEMVDIETFGGQSTQCKVKPIKDSKHEGKGIIQMPEKIQSALDIRKGELVRVKPTVE